MMLGRAAFKAKGTLTIPSGTTEQQPWGIAASHKDCVKGHQVSLSAWGHVCLRHKIRLHGDKPQWWPIMSRKIRQISFSRFVRSLDVSVFYRGTNETWYTEEMGRTNHVNQRQY